VAREFAAPGARRARAAVEAHYFAGAVPTLLRVRRTRHGAPARTFNPCHASLRCRP
jgi:hypothetical protein